MNKFERYAIGHYLTDYPYDSSFDEIIELVEQESEKITVWEPFELYPVEEITDLIAHMKQSLMNLLEIKS